MNKFRFDHPDFLYLYILIPIIIVIYLYTSYRKRKAIEKFGDPEIIDNLMPYVSKNRPVWKFVIMLFAYSLIIFGLCGPQFGTKLQTVKRKGVEIIICLDVSNSMMAQDIQPNRLERAKRSISKMIDKLGDDKIGLVVFAGEAYTQLPITSDYASAKLFLSSINTGIVPVQGTAIGNAIRLATKSFSPESKAEKSIIVITDGENHEDDAMQAASDAQSSGIKIHTIAMGTTEGAPIPINPGSSTFRKDREGNIVISKLDQQMIQQIAVAGGGIPIIANNTTTGLNLLFKEINKMNKTEMESRIYSDYSEKFQIFLALALFLILFEYLILDRKNKFLKDFSLFK
ncbi:MAG: VWA domain-containing protein [Marinifilaceae bacterium]|jgi:Ca-activated chloride channel family protein|nr:VWA domain-containing protein [Marinifilaceae bacterium]